MTTPFWQKNQELLSDLFFDEKEIIFVWVPGHVNIGGNSAAGTAAKGAALDDDISDELTPICDLKPCMNKYIMGL